VKSRNPAASAVAATPVTDGDGQQWEATGPARTEPAWWREKQLRDPKLKALIEYKEEGIIPEEVSEARARGIAQQAWHCEIVEGVLYHLQEVQLGGKGAVETYEQVYVPDVDGLRPRFVRRSHGAKQKAATVRRILFSPE